MWKLIPQMGIPPTRFRRYCCKILKENATKDEFITTGVRWAESSKRKNTRGVLEISPPDIKKNIILNNDNDESRMLFETCALKGKRVCNPIIDWDDKDVWDYTSSEHIPINPLYSCGFDRVGCIGCPLASMKNRQRQFAIYPKYKDMYIAAFDRLIARRKFLGKPPLLPKDNASSGEDLFHYWMGDGILAGQIKFEDYESKIDEYSL